MLDTVTKLDTVGKEVALVGMILFNQTTEVVNVGLFLNRVGVRTQFAEVEMQPKEDRFISHKLFLRDGSFVEVDGDVNVLYSVSIDDK